MKTRHFGNKAVVIGDYIPPVSFMQCLPLANGSYVTCGTYFTEIFYKTTNMTALCSPAHPMIAVFHGVFEVMKIL